MRFSDKGMKVRCAALVQSLDGEPSTVGGGGMGQLLVQSLLNLRVESRMQHVPAHLAAGGVDGRKDAAPAHLERLLEADAGSAALVSLQGPVEVGVLLPLVQLVLLPLVHEPLDLSAADLPADVEVVLHEPVLLRFDAERLDQKRILEAPGDLDAGAQSDLGSSDELDVLRIGRGAGIGHLHQIAEHDRGEHIERAPLEVGVEVRGRGRRPPRRELGHLDQSRRVAPRGRRVEQVGLHEGPDALPVLPLAGEAAVGVRHRLEPRLLLPPEDAPRSLGQPAGIRSLAPQHLHHFARILDDVAGVAGAVFAAEAGHAHRVEIAVLPPHFGPEGVRLLEVGDAAVGTEEGADAREGGHLDQFWMGDVVRRTARLVGVDGTSGFGSRGGMGAGRFVPACWNRASGKCR
mmetsp:Transcript_21795/g.51470  ORF Transcript_21795/g.51470 Transcript_21795/m.51470 type:complete len:404 (+) Transcript_21795:489-1700(+)